MSLKKIHYYSGLTLTLFIGAHLINHFLSIRGAELHLAVMDQLRLVYRNRFVEPVLLAACGVQIVTGVRLFFQGKKEAVSGFEKLHRWSGLYLAFFLVIHLSAVMSGRYLFQLDTNLYFGAAGVNAFPLYFFFVPYYGLAIMAFFAHVASIHHKKMKHSLLGLSVTQQSMALLGIGFLLMLAIFYGLTDHFQGLAMPEGANTLLDK